VGGFFDFVKLNDTDNRLYKDSTSGESGCSPSRERRCAVSLSDPWSEKIASELMGTTETPFAADVMNTSVK